MSEDKINVGREMSALLKALGQEPPFVKDITLTPSKATITRYLKDGTGHKYVVAPNQFLPGSGDQDSEDVTSFSRVPATEVIELAIRT